MSIEAELSASGRSRHHGQSAKRAPPPRPPPGVADHRVLSRGHRSGPPGARRATPVPRRDPGGGRPPGVPGRRGGRQDPPATDRAPPGRGKEDGHRRRPPPSTSGTPGSMLAGNRPGRGAGGAGRPTGAPSPEPTTRAWPAETTEVRLDYCRSWSGRLLDALVESRSRDLERGMSLTGPHRDDLELSVGGLPSRTHVSQGEQRSLALALRLAAHQLATERLGSAPVLLLDDVFSELDPFRSERAAGRAPPRTGPVDHRPGGPTGGGCGQGLRDGGGRTRPAPCAEGTAVREPGSR